MSKRPLFKKRPRFYCYTCLRKLTIEEKDICPCGGEVRKCVHKRSRAQTVTRLRRQRAGKQNGKLKTPYQMYLQTKAWKDLRQIILERDGHTCQICQYPANQVHHKSYKPEVFKGEQNEQLVSLCRECHKSIHRSSRGKRHSLAQTNQKLERLQKSSSVT